MDADMESSRDMIATSPMVSKDNTLLWQNLQQKRCFYDPSQGVLIIEGVSRGEVPEGCDESGREGVNQFSHERLTDFVTYFLSDRKSKPTGKIKSEEIRKYVRVLVIACYHPESFAKGQVNGVNWADVPDGWPSGVEYRDPNNGKKGIPKPRKVALEKMAQHLAEKYTEMYPGSFLDSGRTSDASAAESDDTTPVLPEIHRQQTEAAEVLIQIKQKYEKLWKVRQHDHYMTTLYGICCQLFLKESADVNIITRGYDILKVLGALKTERSLPADLQETLNNLSENTREVASSAVICSPTSVVGKSAVHSRDKLLIRNGAVNFNISLDQSTSINNDAQMNAVQVVDEVGGTLAETGAVGINYTAENDVTDQPKLESTTEGNFRDEAPTYVTAEQESRTDLTDAEQRADEGDPMDVSKEPVKQREESSKTFNTPNTTPRRNDFESSDNHVVQSERERRYIDYGTNRSLHPDCQTFQISAVGLARPARGEASAGQIGAIGKQLAFPCSGAVPYCTVVKQCEKRKSALPEPGDLDELFKTFNATEAAALFGEPPYTRTSSSSTGMSAGIEPMDAYSSYVVGNDCWLSGSFNSTGPTPAKQVRLSTGHDRELITYEEASPYDHLGSSLGDM